MPDYDVFTDVEVAEQEIAQDLAEERGEAAPAEATGQPEQAGETEPEATEATPAVEAPPVEAAPPPAESTTPPVEPGLSELEQLQRERDHWKTVADRQGNELGELRKVPAMGEKPTETQAPPPAASPDLLDPYVEEYGEKTVKDILTLADIRFQQNQQNLAMQQQQMIQETNANRAVLDQQFPGFKEMVPDMVAAAKAANIPAEAIAAFEQNPYANYQFSSYFATQALMSRYQQQIEQAKTNNQTVNEKIEEAARNQPAHRLPAAPTAASTAPEPFDPFNIDPDAMAKEIESDLQQERNAMRR